MGILYSIRPMLPLPLPPSSSRGVCSHTFTLHPDETLFPAL